MKLKFGLRLIGLCGACAAASLEIAHGASPAGSSPVKDSAQGSAVDSSPALSRAEALKVIAESRKYVAHPPKEAHEVVAKPKVTTPDFKMEEPPPPPRAETKPEAPGAGYVWVEGHYMPVKGTWRWVRGEWAVPALPISVWIPARYDAKEKRWDPGYWQPDVSTTVPAAELPQDGAKSAPPTNGY